MKTSLLLPALVIIPGALFAQQPPLPPSNPPLLPPPPSAQATSPAPVAPPRGPMGNLSEVEKAQVKAAHDKAIQQDPALEQRMKEARQAMDAAKKAMHDAMVRVDPSVETILAKMTPPPKSPGAPGPRGINPPPQSLGGNPVPPATSVAETHPPVPGLANLSEEERTRIKSLHEQVKNDPAVVAARQVLDAAVTPADRSLAEEALHKVRREAMIKADPSAEVLLSKLHGGSTGSPQPAGSPGQ